MARLRTLAQEALTWPHLSDRQRLMWATVLQLDVVPLPEMTHGWVGWDGAWWVHQRRPGGIWFTKSDTSFARIQKDVYFCCLSKGVRYMVGLVVLGFGKSYPARSGAPATRSCMFWLGMVRRSTALVGYMCIRVFHIYIYIMESQYQVDASRSCLHGFWSGRTSPEDIQARDRMSSFFPVGISKHAENAAMAISAIIPWLLADQHAAQCNST